MPQRLEKLLLEGVASYLDCIHPRFDLFEDTGVLIHRMHPHAHSGRRQRHLEISVHESSLFAFDDQEMPAAIHRDITFRPKRFRLTAFLS